jgi:hypothetical protein
VAESSALSLMGGDFTVGAGAWEAWVPAADASRDTSNRRIGNILIGIFTSWFSLLSAILRRDGIRKVPDVVFDRSRFYQ